MVKRTLAVAFTLLFFASEAVAQVCVGDCDGDGVVRIDELSLGVRMALGQEGIERCPGLDRDNGRVCIDDLIVAVYHALAGCPLPPGQYRYSLVGTANGQPAEGQLLIRFASTGLNLIVYEIISFAFADLSGTGTAELFTLSGTFTVNVNTRTPEQAEVRLRGTARLAGGLTRSEPWPVFGEFNLTGNGYTLTFSATPR